MTRGLRRLLNAIRRYPMVVVSLLIILFLLAISAYAMIAIPLGEAIELWQGRDQVWQYTPRCAQPAWTNVFRREKLPKTVLLSLHDFEHTEEQLSATSWRETTVMTFGHNTTSFPSEVTFFYTFRYGAKAPLVTLTWIKPDGSEAELLRSRARGGASRLRIELEDAFGGPHLAEPEADLGADAEDGTLSAVKGEYGLRVEVLSFDDAGFSIGGQLVVYGAVHGIAGTDIHRRDLLIGLLWGTPVALMFGFLAATGTTLFGFVIAAIGAWFRGWPDAVIQRITEVNMMIPFLPTILMVAGFYSSSIWVLLGFIVGFSLFTGRLKSYRAMFLQLVHSEYVEAARACGASSTRIIFRYLIPRAFPTVVPHLILGIPLFVFLETSLAFLGIADPSLPTWGKILSEARVALYMGHYHWVLGPAFLLVLTGLSFSMLGYTLDRVFNPRLRDI